MVKYEIDRLTAYIRPADLLQLSTLITRLKTVPVPPAPTAKSAPVWVAKTHRDRISRLRQLSAMGIPPQWLSAEIFECKQRLRERKLLKYWKHLRIRWRSSSILACNR